MKIDTLYEYVVLAKHLNFSAAAKELYLSQPGLSIHISNLEKELGFTLIDRENGITLTPAGLIFLDTAQDILERYKKGTEECKAVAEAPPLVRIMANGENPQFMSLLTNTSDIPFTFVSLEEDTPVLRALEKNLIDIGHCPDFTCNPQLYKESEKLNVGWFAFGEFPASISMMKTHPLAQKNELTKEDFINASIVINNGVHYDSWKAIVQSFFGEDFPLVFRLDPIGSLSNLVFTDFGESIHICGGRANETYLSNRNDVVLFDTLDGKPLMHKSLIVYRTDNPNKNVHTVIDSIRKQL